MHYIIYRYNRYKNFIIGLYTVGTCLTYWFKHIYDKKGATHRSSRKQIPTGRCNYAACNVQPIQDYECGLSYLLVVPYASLFVRSSCSHRLNLQVVSATKVRHLSGEDSAMEATHRNKNNINTLCDPCTLSCSAEDNSRYVSEVSYQWNLDSKFRIQSLAGIRIPWAEFRSPGFWIPRAKFLRIAWDYVGRETSALFCLTGPN